MMTEKDYEQKDKRVSNVKSNNWAWERRDSTSNAHTQLSFNVKMLERM